MLASVSESPTYIKDVPVMSQRAGRRKIMKLNGFADSIFVPVACERSFEA
jgi:hypothetical protein